MSDFFVGKLKRNRTETTCSVEAVTGVSSAAFRAQSPNLTAGQKSAEGILGHVVGKVSEALRSRKAESTDRPSRER
jgi:hypothetical protein